MAFLALSLRTRVVKPERLTVGFGAAGETDGLGTTRFGAAATAAAGTLTEAATLLPLGTTFPNEKEDLPATAGFTSSGLGTAATTAAGATLTGAVAVTTGLVLVDGCSGLDTRLPKENGPGFDMTMGAGASTCTLFAGAAGGAGRRNEKGLDGAVRSTGATTFLGILTGADGLTTFSSGFVDSILAAATGAGLGTAAMILGGTTAGLIGASV